MTGDSKALILLVDDTPANLHILSQALHDDYQIKVATSGYQAIDVIRQHPPDIILLDIMMPDIDGYEVCRRLKSNPSFKDIPVIFVTAKGEIADETKGLSLGAVDYITKPYVVDIVKARLAAHIQLKENIEVNDRLREESERRELLFKAIAEQSAQCSYVENEDGSLIYATPACSILTGYSSEELFQSREFLSTLLHDEDRHRWQALMDAVDLGVETDPVEFRINRLDGDTRWIEFHVMPTDSSENTWHGRRATAIDITERYQAAKALSRAKEQAELGERCKSAFLSTISHELRTPLNSVVGHAELVQQENLNEHQRKHIDEILNASSHLIGIIDSVVDYARLESNDIKLNLKAFNPRQIMKGLRQAFDTRIVQHDITFELSVGDDVPASLCGDSPRILQVLHQLIDNAIKFSVLKDAVINVAMSWDQQNNTLHVAVKDNGIGMNSDQLQNIFTIFSQADSSTRREYGGTGIGLALARQLVKFMGGNISVEFTAPGQGSVMTLNVPLDVADQEEQVPHRIEKIVNLTGKVLVVEDNKVNQALFAQQLKVLGVQSLVVGNGLQGLEAWKNSEFDLILTDLHMPEMDGIEMVTKIREQEKLCDKPTSNTVNKRTPIVAATADTTSDVERRCLSAGMDQVLIKPVTWNALSSALQHWLLSNSVESQ